MDVYLQIIDGIMAELREKDEEVLAIELEEVEQILVKHLCRDGEYHVTEMLPHKTWYFRHLPTRETLVALGIDRENGKVLTAGYPPTLLNLRDCYGFHYRGPIQDSEREYRTKLYPDRYWI